MQSATHETLTREEPVTGGSERSFGLVMAVFLLLISLINFYHEGAIYPWSGAASVLFLTLAIFRAQALRRLNRMWLNLGSLLHRVVNPLVMALIFYGAVLPTGLVMRALGNDLLRLKMDPKVKSYWIRRERAESDSASMVDQF